VAAFSRNKKLNNKQVDELRKLIDSYEEDNNG
jgi:predicted transcriptional regulator